jgi:distribution and morphology protein 10
VVSNLPSIVHERCQLAEKNHLVSTGIRFTTLPDATPPSSQPSSSPASSSPSAAGLPSQTPTTITALFNPMMGHVSTAYAAQVSDNLSLASRFDFNFYSYESEWTLGAEWWMRRAGSNPDFKDPGLSEEPPPPPDSGDVHGVVKARASTTNV